MLLDGKSIDEMFSGDDVVDSEMSVVEPRLYNVVRGQYGSKLLVLEVQNGFEFNAFTFG